MSLHPVHVPTREDVVRAYTRPIPKAITRTCLALAAIGVLAFIVGVMSDPDRAWRAYHVSWLFFTSLSSAGVMFVASVSPRPAGRARSSGSKKASWRSCRSRS